MTSPLIELFPIGDESRQPLGSGRLLWANMRPSQAVNPIAVWYTQGVETALSMGENPNSQQSLGFDAADGGAYVARAVQTSRIWTLDDRAALQSPLFNAVNPVAYPDPAGLLIFREVVRWTLSTVGTAGNASTFHGIACVFDTQGNAGWGPDLLTGNVFAGVGVIFRANTGTYRLFTKARATPAVQTVIPYAGGTWALLEHRLYAPTINRVGRYELWINQALIATIDGTDPDFPQVDANNVRYRPAPYISENYAGKTGGLRVRRSEIIVGPDADSTRAYE